MTFRVNRTAISQRFEVLAEISREYRGFNAIDRQIRVRLNTPIDPATNHMGSFLASVNDLFEQALQDVGDADMVGSLFTMTLIKAIDR